MTSHPAILLGSTPPPPADLRVRASDRRTTGRDRRNAYALSESFLRPVSMVCCVGRLHRRWQVLARDAVIRTFAMVVLFGCASTTGNPERASVAGSSGNGDGGADSEAGSNVGGGEAGGGSGELTLEPVACRPAAMFTACVKTCGEPDGREPKSAECVNGFYACAEPLVPAVACPADSWPDGPNAGCGPWVDGYDCPFKSVCDDGLWSCPAPGDGD
jgi:hypothetical protein